jgi:hypothetical protein
VPSTRDEQCSIVGKRQGPHAGRIALLDLTLDEGEFSIAVDIQDCDGFIEPFDVWIEFGVRLQPNRKEAISRKRGAHDVPIQMRREAARLPPFLEQADRLTGPCVADLEATVRRCGEDRDVHFCLRPLHA